MTKEQKQVKEFMQVFGQECPGKPTMPSVEVRKLRAKLILEEALECVDALGFGFDGSGNAVDNYLYLSVIKKPNLTKLADGLADLHYVAYCGTALACGLDVEPISAEVHRSNMTKLWTYNEVEDYKIDNLKTNGFAELTYNQVIGIDIGQDQDSSIQKVYLVQNKDGKVIKSPSYSPANLKPIIDAQILTHSEQLQKVNKETHYP